MTGLGAFLYLAASFALLFRHLGSRLLTPLPLCIPQQSMSHISMASDEGKENIRNIKEAVSYFTHIFFSFFLAFLQTSYRFSLIKTYKLHYFYLILYSETTDCGEITVTTTLTSGLDLCIFPCSKQIILFTK